MTACTPPPTSCPVQDWVRPANTLTIYVCSISYFLDGTIDELVSAASLESLYLRLALVPSFGRFLAFQFAIDLNYSALFPFSEMDYVVAGPGAYDGVAKCFLDTDGLTAEDVIRAVTASAEECFDHLGIDFQSLWGRPLQLMDYPKPLLRG